MAVETTTVERELVELETNYWQAMQDKDVDAALRMTDFPCLVAGATGVAQVDRDAFVKMMEGARFTLHEFEVKDVHMRLLKDDVALMVYRIHEDLTVDGEKVSMDAADSSVWVRKGGKWLCALHTEALKGDPYGRDRQALPKAGPQGLA